MAEITSDAVIGFAKQGHPQAIAVLLNRALVPKGAHVKVRQKKEVLKVLVNFLRETELDQLVTQVQSTFDDLSPANIKRVQIFTQRLGDKQASFQKEIALAASSADSTLEVSTAQSTSPELDSKARSHASAQNNTTASHPTVQSSRGNSSDSTTAVSQGRYSVAEFLSQVSNIEELDVLTDHPFFTGVCPSCSHEYANLENPPLFWDCPACGWQDDLRQKVPSHQLRETPQRRKIHQGKRLGSYLIEAGLLTPAQIEVALADQQLAGIRLGEVLVRRGWIKEETVEYFMRKVIEPERQSSSGQAEAYLESSRNLLKTLIQSKESPDTADPAAISRDLSASDTIPGTKELDLSNGSSSKVSGKNLANSKETLILTDIESRTVKPREPITAVNERETLLLPDLEIQELLEQESDS